MKGIGCGFSHDKTSPQHDFRISISKNVDKDLIKYNEVLVDELQGKDIEQYINEYMQPVIDEFNAKQKRNDRKINTNYCDYWKNNGKLNRGETQLVYEGVISLGGHDNIGTDFYLNMELQKYMDQPQVVENLKKPYMDYYSKVLKDIKVKYPNLKVLYAVVHFDEPQGTPHLHIGYMGVGENYKQGLSKQISISNALTSCGIERVESRSQGKDGYQIKRFYDQVRQEILRPNVEIFLNNDFYRDRYFLKEEEHNATHVQKEEYQYLSKIIEQEYNDKFGTIEELDNKINAKKSDIREKEQDQKELEKNNIILNNKNVKLEKEIITAETKLKNVEQEYEDLSNKNELLKKTDEILEKNNGGTILYKSKKVGPLTDRKTVYEVSEEELKALLSNCKTSENLMESLVALTNKSKELDEREQNLIDDIGRLNSRKSEFSAREQEFKRERQQFEQEKGEFAKLIEEKAQELLEAFLTEFPHIRKIYYDFLKLKRFIAPPKKRYYQSHDFDR